MAAIVVVGLPAAYADGGAHGGHDAGAAPSGMARHGWMPVAGPLFNDPKGSWAAQDNQMHNVIESIAHAPRHSEIDIATWSYFLGRATDALIAAARRGVVVHFVMARGKSEVGSDFGRLRAAFRARNAAHPRAKRSVARTCAATCRGTHGTMHTKMFLFSRTGAAKDVAMWGSPNVTTNAIRHQWNELFTVVNRTKVYEYAKSVFHQLWRDRPHPQPFVVHWFGQVGLAPLPYRGRIDWVSRQLDKVSCRDTVTGSSGGRSVRRTRIQAANAVLSGSVGASVAQHLRTLWNRGCMVSLMYTRLDHVVHGILESPGGRGPVPIHPVHIDVNGDGIYDDYLHLKVLAIHGDIGNRPDATLVMDGSANWANLSRSNDEMLGYFKRPWVYWAYSRWLDHMWQHAPWSARLAPGARTLPSRDRFAHVELD